VLSYGFLLGELVRRVTGRPVRDAVRQRLLDPLGLRDTHLGTDPADWGRRVPLRGGQLGRATVRQLVFNRRSLREAVIPAATFSGTARDLARFYQAMLDGGGPVLGPASVAQACAPSNHGEVDRVLGKKVRWSHGFQLGGTDDDPTLARPFGRRSGRRTFGHNGSNTCMGWADPDRRLVVAYLTDRGKGGRNGSPHQSAVSDALLAGCD
jgi:CubicO group peptidase (beta-lactamase class C family)